MNKCKTLFNKGKIDDLGELIDNFNKDFSSIEYRFNFTLIDKNKETNKYLILSDVLSQKIA
jgi:hypothetical protein